MNNRLQIILISAFIYLYPPSVIHAQSNLEIFFGKKSPEKYQDVVVEAISNTGTISLKNNLQGSERISLIGLKPLTVPRDRKKQVERDEHGFIVKEDVNPETSLEDRGLDYVKKLLEGKHVRLEFDINHKDDNGTTAAYVFSVEDNTFINAEIIRQGYAHLSIQPPNTKYADELRAAYREAREEKRGIHSQ